MYFSGVLDILLRALGPTASPDVIIIRLRTVSMGYDAKAAICEEEYFIYKERQKNR